MLIHRQQFGYDEVSPIRTSTPVVVAGASHPGHALVRRVYILKRGTPRHPKTYALAESLGVPLYAAVGILEMLWHHANQYTPRGDIGSLPDTAIAESVAWNKKPRLLIDGLVSSKWLELNEEYRLIVHDWPDHCEQSAIKWLEYNHADFLPIYGVSLEKRKRKSRDSLSTRVAMAMAKDSEDLKEKKDGEILPPELDDQWQNFRRLYLDSGKPLIEEDFRKAHIVWRVLDFAQRTMALANLASHKLLTDPQFIPKPERFLTGGEYARAVVARTSGNGKKYLTDEEKAAL